MSEFTPHLAPIVVLALLGSVFLVGVSILVLLYGALHWSKTIVAFGLGGGLSVVGCYLMLLVGFSLASGEKNLLPGGWKYFCEVDCHIGYSVTGTQTAEFIGPELQPVSPQGQFVIVGVKVWFDEHTISPTRGNGPLTPNPRRAVLVDQSGRTYEESDRGEVALSRASANQMPFSQPLRPGESFTRQLAFDVPKDARGLRLLITEDDFESHLLIGHETALSTRRSTSLSIRPARSPERSVR